MKKLITVRADSNISGYTDITLPLIKKYAEKWGADFKLLTEEFTYSTVSDGKFHYRILKLGDLLDEYDKILNLDADIIINKNCPNPFEVFNEDYIYTCLEDKGSRKMQRHQVINNIQKQFGNIGWRNEYINTGFFMVSKKHKDIFQPIKNTYWNGFGFDDALLGYNIKKLKLDIKDIGYKYNHMIMFNEAWNGKPKRFNSFIIHYAGAGVFDNKIPNKFKQIKKDFNTIYEEIGVE